MRPETALTLFRCLMLSLIVGCVINLIVTFWGKP
jgi:hypothetical protein